jgi:uncharacterized repeat protein (TIGR04076 family)
MKKVKITVVKTTFNQDLADMYASDKYATAEVGLCEAHKCGEVYYTNGWQKPQGMCDNAWKSMMEYAMTLAHGGSSFYEDWMRNPKSALVACNDGLRPVSFLLEATDEKAEIFE